MQIISWIINVVIILQIKTKESNNEWLDYFKSLTSFFFSRLKRWVINRDNLKQSKRITKTLDKNE